MSKKTIQELLAEKKKQSGIDEAVETADQPIIAASKYPDNNQPAENKKIAKTISQTLNLLNKDVAGKLNLVSFKIGKHYFGVDILKVQEVVKPHEITRVPHLETAVLGIMNLRGTIAPVIDLRIRLGLSDIAFTAQTRIIIVKVNNQLVGLKVDSVAEIIGITENDIEEADHTVSGIDAKYINGIAKIDTTAVNETGMVVLLEPDQIMQNRVGLTLV